MNALNLLFFYFYFAVVDTELEVAAATQRCKRVVQVCDCQFISSLYSELTEPLNACVPVLLTRLLDYYYLGNRLYSS